MYGPTHTLTHIPIRSQSTFETPYTSFNPFLSPAPNKIYLLCSTFRTDGEGEINVIKCQVLCLNAHTLRMKPNTCTTDAVMAEYHLQPELNLCAEADLICGRF
jgi:hypothetical protein